HCQVAPPNAPPKLGKEYGFPTLTDKQDGRTTKAQHRVCAMAGKVPNQSCCFLTNFVPIRKVGAYKSATDTYTRTVKLSKNLISLNLINNLNVNNLQFLLFDNILIFSIFTL